MDFFIGNRTRKVEVIDFLRFDHRRLGTSRMLLRRKSTCRRRDKCGHCFVVGGSNPSRTDSDGSKSKNAAVKVEEEIGWRHSSVLLLPWKRLEENESEKFQQWKSFLSGEKPFPQISKTPLNLIWVTTRPALFTWRTLWIYPLVTFHTNNAVILFLIFKWLHLQSFNFILIEHFSNFC